jgi:hypothetical protein
MNYPEPALTKIYLWGCKNIPIFQLCFLKLMNKGDKYGKYNYQAVKNFNYDMVKVTIFNIDRISNRIDISSED